MKIKGEFLAAILTAVLCISGNLLAYSGGDGTTGNPYQIADVNNFQQLSATPAHWNKSFILTADINLTGLTFTQAPIAPDIGNTQYWDGFQGTWFTGIFDGNDHVISNLTITALTQDYVGLCGCVGSGGQIRNLGVENVNITGRYYVGGLVGGNGHWSGSGTLTGCYVTGSVNGTDQVGGLVGDNEGTLISCYATGSVSGTDEVGGLAGWNNSGTLIACYATGSVSGTGMVGGLVGINYPGTLTSCYATGSVSGTDRVGGLVGYNYGGTLTACYATGSVNGNGQDVGGLVGSNNYGLLASCYATGFVPGTRDFVGGLVGWNYEGTITDCFWDFETSGQATSGGGTGKTTAEMKTLSTFTSEGWDFINVWAIGQNQTYPYLKTEPAGDLNYDKKVDFADFAIFAENWLAGI